MFLFRHDNIFLRRVYNMRVRIFLMAILAGIFILSIGYTVNAQVTSVMGMPAPIPLTAGVPASALPFSTMASTTGCYGFPYNFNTGAGNSGSLDQAIFGFLNMVPQEFTESDFLAIVPESVPKNTIEADVVKKAETRRETNVDNVFAKFAPLPEDVINALKYIL
jgi:hypothetical protein